VKRVLDFTCALCGLVLLSPLLVLIAAAVWLEDRHSPLYAGRRVGLHGGVFPMAKFRTMVPDAWRTGVLSTASTDPRITRVGRWLRALKLDELPQLWNVLRGQMSLVGPRPQVVAEVSLYTEEERRLLTVRPGVTDLASIVFADEAEILSGSGDPDLLYHQIIRPWKSRLGLLYVERRTMAADLWILGLTLLAAVSRGRALAGVARLIERWDAGPALQRLALRRDALPVGPPPGSNRIVERYRRKAMHA
jgi:lipopolysaccharide/colanic/teichoic acid biosynthesis glycosyltransferase